MICAAVSGCGAGISQPEVLTFEPRPSWLIACWVITVLGADVPDGRAPSCWITGLARHWRAGHGKEVWSGPFPLFPLFPLFP